MTDTTMTQAEGEAYLANFGASPEEITAYYAEPRSDHDFLTAVFALMTTRMQQNQFSQGHRGE